MRKLVAVAAASVALTFLPVPHAGAQGDPKIPNGEAGWCPGGKAPGYGGQHWCLGEAFPDGSFYAQMWSLGPGGPFAPGAWHKTASCKAWVNGQIQGGLPYGGVPQCGGGPNTIRL
mgnify:CR=1 FL=1